MLLDKIEKDNILPPIEDRVFKDKFPVVMWGAGDIALSYYQFFLEKGFSFAGFVVDEKWYIPGMQFMGKMVETFSMARDRLGCFSVFVGHADSKSFDKLKEMDFVKNIHLPIGIAYGQGRALDYRFFLDNELKYEELFNSLQDNLSKECLIAFLNARICNDVSYVWPVSPKSRITYFNNDVFKVNTNESLLDIGAYTGDTIRDFINANKDYKKIVSIEADRNNFSKLKAYVETEKLRDIDIINKGVWEKKDVLFLSEDAEESSVLPKEEAKNATTKKQITGYEIEVFPIDELVEKRDYRFSVLKVNFYYGVLEVLEGAKKVIKKDRPVIITTVGFDEKALLNIPQYIQKSVNNYSLFLRYLQAMPGRLTLFAIPKERL